ncbi:MAG TPA: Ig-like domain-containing protein [Longimicrobiales bacterium]|nr:Ig-like domain-containing protein [Longimicrobiales bacterium]
MSRYKATFSAGLGCVLLLAACGEDPISVLLPSSAAIAIHAGDGQVGSTGSMLPLALAVRVTAGGRPIKGVAITWSVATGSGSITETRVLTGSDGIARVERRLGPIAGTLLTTALIEDAGKGVQFTSVAQVQGAIRMRIVTGDQQARADTVLGTAQYRVLVTDQNDVPVAGVVVRWTRIRGVLSDASTVTDAQGMAHVTHTQGSETGFNTVHAAVPGLLGSPLTFTTVVGPGQPVSLVKVSGDSQVVVLSYPLNSPFVVHVSDRHGNSVSGAAISWFGESGTGTTLLSQGATFTGALNGEARPVAAYWHDAGTEVGSFTVSARATTIAGAPAVTFAFLVMPLPPANVFVTGLDEYNCYYWGNCTEFSHPDIRVKAGGTVTWTWWSSSESHNVVFEDDPTEPVSSAAKQSGTHTRTFTAPGTIRYRCTLHSTDFADSKAAKVTVVE